MSSRFLKLSMQSIVTDILKLIHPSDIFLGRIPLTFYTYPYLPSYVVEMLVKKLLGVSPRTISKVFSKISEDYYMVSDAKIANLIEWAQSYIQMNIRNIKHRFLWSILALSTMYEAGSPYIELPLQEVLRIGYLEYKEVTRILSNINRELREFMVQQLSSLTGIIKISETGKVIEKPVNILKAKDLEQLAPTIKLENDKIIVHNIGELELVIREYARLAFKNMKYIKPLLDILCNYMGPCEKRELLEIASTRYGFKRESVRVKHYYIARKHDFIKEERIGSALMVIPNCSKCIYFINPSRCKEEVLKALKNLNNINELSRLPNYILRPFIQRFFYILNNIREMKRLSDLVGNKVLIDMLRQGLQNELMG